VVVFVEKDKYFEYPFVVVEEEEYSFVEEE
jgi:hypothetical protein